MDRADAVPGARVQRIALPDRVGRVEAASQDGRWVRVVWDPPRPEWLALSDLRPLPECCYCICEHRCAKDRRVIGHQGCVACKWCSCDQHGRTPEVPRGS